METKKLDPKENPLESIYCTIAFDSKDYSVSRRDAWIYGIVCGWDDESIKDLSKKHEWTNDDISRLKRLNARFKEIKSIEEASAALQSQ